MRFSLGVGCGAVLILVAVEVFLRFMPVNSAARMADTGAEMPISRYVPEQDYVYSFGWAMANAKSGRTSRDGFVNSPDFSSAADILVIGDSFIESLMLDYPQTLQGRLSSSTKATVVAAAASGNGLADSLDIARHFVPLLHPRTIIFFVEPSDISLLTAPPVKGHSAFVQEGDRVTQIHNPYVESRYKVWIQKSALVRYVFYNLKISDFLGKWLRGTPVAQSVPGASGAKEGFLRYYLSELKRLADLNHFQVLFLVDGDRKAIYAGHPVGDSWRGNDRALFLSLVPQYGGDIVDMQPVFLGHWVGLHERMDFLPMDGHWNPVAHRLAADEILKHLKSPSGAIPERH